MNPEDLFYDSDELAESAYARVLLKSLPKIGKTCAVCCTAPGPIGVLNADGDGGLQPAKRRGAKVKYILDVTSHKLWIDGCTALKTLAEQQKVTTIFVDTVSLLVNDVLVPEFTQKFAGTKDEGFGTYRETLVSVARGIRILRKAPAHLIVSVHVDSELKLDMSGQTKEQLPRLLNDIVYMDFDAMRNPPRAFRIGPSAAGLTGSRSSNENKVLPADVGVLLQEFGLAI